MPATLSHDWLHERSNLAQALQCVFWLGHADEVFIGLYERVVFLKGRSIELLSV